MFKIGNVVIEGVTALAPMAGVCNNAFREICREHGASLIYCEMVNEKGLVNMNPRTVAMTRVSSKEHPVALQIFGSDLASFKQAAIYCDKHSDCDIIDINMGCPVPKVAEAAQAGAALLRDIKKVELIVSTIVQSVSKPVTVKIRTGWDETSINCVEVALAVERAGALAIAVHGRTRKQMYTGKADLDLIRAVKQAVRIPVIGNGDIFSPGDARRMIEYTGCDAVMIARGAQGNPWIFRQVEEALANNAGVVDEEPSVEEVMRVMMDHARRLVVLKDERVAMLEMRGHAIHYMKRANVAKQIRIQAVQVKSLGELQGLADLAVAPLSLNLGGV